jgi:hypothetical protein
MKIFDRIQKSLVKIALSVLLTGTAVSQASNQCAGLPEYQKLKAALTSVVKEGKEANSGMGNPEWATIVNRDGIVCAVVFSGPDRSAEWPGSRLISAEKANNCGLTQPMDGHLWLGRQHRFCDRHYCFIGSQVGFESL